MKLIKGECRQEMSKFDDGSINLIICDLPYGTTACEWDAVIDTDDLFYEYKRILADNGTALLFGSEPFSTSLRVAAMDIYRYDHIWLKNKVSGFVHAKNKPMKDFETLSVFSKGTTVHEGMTKNKMTYNPQGLIKVENPKFVANDNEDLNVIKVRGEGYKTEYTNYPRMTIKCDFKEKRYHPTQKPTKLYEYLIKTYSNPGDVILDNCAGSGTLGAAGLSIPDRDYIMIELEPEYQDVIVKRIPDIEVIEGDDKVYRRTLDWNVDGIKSLIDDGNGVREILDHFDKSRKELDQMLKKEKTSLMRLMK